jgi:hypothetical protein
MDSINTEDFISETEAQPVLWNTASEQYCNKISKCSTWVEVILKFHPLFKEKMTGKRKKKVFIS